MGLSSQKETHESYTRPVSSSCTSINGVLHRRPSKETIQSQEGSISNFSFHSATAAIDKDRLDLFGQGHLSNHSSNTSNDQDPSISDHKSAYSLEKPTFGFRNQSLSTVCTIYEPESGRNSTATSTPRQSVSSLEDEAESSPPSTPCTPCVVAPTLIAGPSPSPSPVHADPPSHSSGDGDSQPLATVEVSTAVTPTIQEHQEPPSNVNIHAGATANYKDPFIPSRQALPSSGSRSVPDPIRNRGYKSYDSSRPALSSRRASKITVEYHKPSRQSIQEYQQLLTNVNQRAAEAAKYKDPFVPSRQAPPPPSSHNASKPSKSRDRDSSASVSHHKSRNFLHTRSRGPPVFTPPTTIHEAESDPFSTAPSTPQQEFSPFTLPPTKEMATFSVPPTPPRPSRANTVNLADLYADPNLNPVHSTAPTTLLDSSPPFSDISKRPVVLTPRKAHSSGGQQVVPTSHPPASYRPAPSPPQPAQPNLDRLNSQRSVSMQPRSETLVRASTTKDQRSPGPPASADLAMMSQATVAVNGPVAERLAPQPPTAPQQQSAAVASLTKTTGATPRRRKRKKEDKANDADIVKRLQQICTDADPTWLYRNLVKVGHG